MEKVNSIQIRRGHTTTRSYDQIVVHLHGLRLAQDLMCDLDIRQAYLLAKSHDATFEVAPEYAERVSKAIAKLSAEAA
jgi:hypothetical protein